MVQSHAAKRRQPGLDIMLILVLMLMRCLRNRGFDRPYMATSFVIRDPRYVKESTNCISMLHTFNGRWLVGLGVQP